MKLNEGKWKEPGHCPARRMRVRGWVHDRAGEQRRGTLHIGELCFEASEAAVLEAEVRPGGGEPFVQGPVVGGELAYSLFEGGVLGRDALGGLLAPFGFEVADLAHEFPETGALLDDLGPGGLEGVLGVECPFPPGCLLRGAGGGQVLGLAGAVAGDGGGDGGACAGVGVEEGAGDCCPAGEGCDGDRGFLAAHPRDGVADAQERGLAGGPAGREGGRGLVLAACGVIHAAGCTGSPCAAWFPSPSWSSWLPARARSEARNAVFQTRSK